MTDEVRRKMRGSTSPTRRVVLGVSVLLATLILLVTLVIGRFAVGIRDSLNQLDRDEAMLPPTATSTQESGPLNIVLMGTDSRTPDDRGRSDSLMVLHLSGDRTGAYLISFPRDLWVQIPAHGKAKINAAYAWGGPELTVQTLQGLTGADIHHGVIVDFAGLVGLVDAVGGIAVTNDQATTSGGHDFPQGHITLNGEQALAYSRERYQLVNGDLDRGERQRDVVKATAAELLDAGTLTNPVKVNEATDAVAPFVTVDAGLTTAKITDLVQSMRIRSADDIHSLMAPVAGFGTSSDGQSYDIVNDRVMAELSAALRNDTMDDYYERHKDDPVILPG